MNAFGYTADNAVIAMELEDSYVWDCSVIYAEGKYHMFSSRWKREWGFGWNWVYNSEIIQCVSDRPEGPYTFLRVVLPRRGRQYFDGMSTHNTCVRYHDGKYYLYYMGTTYGGPIPQGVDPEPERNLEVWNRKRIGVAVAESIYGEFVRQDQPLLEPRDCSHWDCTVTTNPTVAILPNGKTYMVYKSRSGYAQPLKLGISVADRPDGPFTRLCDEPILQFDDPDFHVEDPYLWYDAKREKFCLIAKDDVKNGSYGITGEWGSGFYAESDDCIHFEIPDEPKVYSRLVHWKDGHESQQGNMERPWVLFDEQGEPQYLFCASGAGPNPYSFEGKTFVVAQELRKKDSLQ